MRIGQKLAVVAAGGLMVSVCSMAWGVAKAVDPVQGSAVVTILPAKNAQTVPEVKAEDLELKIDGKAATVTSWQAVSGASHPLEVVVLIDAGASTSLSTQLEYLQNFVTGLPTEASVAVGYMQNGRALMASELTRDRARVLRGMRMFSGGGPGISASPYFCLSDLAKNWPSKNTAARRLVVMISNGVDHYSEGYDPSDPYVLAAISDALRSHMAVYAIYWHNKGSMAQADASSVAGQSWLAQVADATGGVSYYTGFADPVSIQSYLQDITDRMAHQYQLQYASGHVSHSGVVELRLKLKNAAGKVTAPRQSYPDKAAAAR